MTTDFVYPTTVSGLTDEKLHEVAAAVTRELERRTEAKRRKPFGDDDYTDGYVFSFVVRRRYKDYTYVVVKADAFAWYTTSAEIGQDALPKRVTWDELTAWCVRHGVEALVPMSRQFSVTIKRAS